MATFGATRQRPSEACSQCILPSPASGPPISTALNKVVWLAPSQLHSSEGRQWEVAAELLSVGVFDSASLSNAYYPESNRGAGLYQKFRTAWAPCCPRSDPRVCFGKLTSSISPIRCPLNDHLPVQDTTHTATAPEGEIEPTHAGSISSSVKPSLVYSSLCSPISGAPEALGTRVPQWTADRELICSSAPHEAR